MLLSNRSGLHDASHTPAGAQAKLSVSSPGDVYEQEADRIADAVASSGAKAPSVREDLDSSAIERVQRREHTPESTVDAPDFIQGGPGRALDPVTRAEFEHHFDRDFSDVRIHDDAEASKSAQALNAVAYTVGRDIVFRDGAYAPATPSGKKLLAHELTHVVQQTGGNKRGDERAGPQSAHGIAGSARMLSRAPDDEKAKVATLAADLQKLIDGAVWKEIRKRVYPKESAAGIKRAKERKAGKLPDLTGLGKISALTSFAAAIKSLQGKWAAISVDDRVKAIGDAANVELTAAGVPPFRFVVKAKTPWKGFFQAAAWKFSISDQLVNGATLSDSDAAELCNTALHEARHAEQYFLAARYAAGPPNNKLAPDIAAEEGIPEDPIANAAVAAKFGTTTDARVADLGKQMYKAHVTEKAANQKISDDDYMKEMGEAREAAIKSLAALKAKATAATIADATLKRTTLEAAIAEVEKRYTLYRNIPYEADAHEVGDAAEQAFKGWP
jgi:hypothetical protein